MNKQEIRDELGGKGDFIRIDYLNRFLRENPAIDMKRFAYLNLAETYDKIGMFIEAAKMFNNLAVLSIAFSEKIKNHLREAELYIKAGEFERVDEAMKKAMSEANASERAEIYFSVKWFYKKQADIYESELKRNNAARIYEKLLIMNLADSEREEIKEKLIGLYEKLARFDDVKRLRVK